MVSKVAEVITMGGKKERQEQQYPRSLVLVLCSCVYVFECTNESKVASIFKVLTALVSITTALFLFRISPRVLLALQEVSPQGGSRFCASQDLGILIRKPTVMKIRLWLQRV